LFDENKNNRIHSNSAHRPAIIIFQFTQPAFLTNFKNTKLLGVGRSLELEKLHF
jgi:hypothetical protein